LTEYGTEKKLLASGFESYTPYTLVPARSSLKRVR
jgi:hypothetical protein